MLSGKMRIAVLAGMVVAASCVLLSGRERSGGAQREQTETAKSAPRTVVAGGAVSLAGPNSPVLGGAPFTILARGEPETTMQWQFGYRKEVLSRGRVLFDPDGVARVRLIAPKLRRRTACRFLLLSPHRDPAETGVIVYPETMLSAGRELLRKLGVGVIDDTGAIQRALKAEKVPFWSLRTRLERAGFDGNMVILGGFRRAEYLLVECEKLQGRLEGGVDAVIVGPPVGWEAFGIRRVKLKSRTRTVLKLRRGFASVVEPGDLGQGPWKAALRSDGASVALGWFVPAAASRSTTAPGEGAVGSGTKRALILSRPVGRGRVTVAAIPQTDAPASNPVGRAVLNELVLWTLKQRSPSCILEEKRK